MQVIDNLLVIHDLDSRSTQVYDFKIVDYSVPLLRPNLRVDLSHSDRYISDFFLPEEIPKPEGEDINALGLKNKISEDKAEPEPAVVEEEEKKEVSEIDIYDDQTIFIAPMFIVHPTKFRSMSLKLSLHSYVTSCAEDCNLMLISSTPTFFSGLRLNCARLSLWQVHRVLGNGVALRCFFQTKS